VDASQDKTWVDPLVGPTRRSPREHRVRLGKARASLSEGIV